MKAGAKKWYSSHTRNQCWFKQQTVKISLYFRLTSKEEILKI